MTADVKETTGRHLRFSLRSLILLVALAGSGYGLWMHWESWEVRKTLKGHVGRIRVLSFSVDGTRLVSRSSGWASEGSTRVWDVRSGKTIIARAHSGQPDGG